MTGHPGRHTVPPHRQRRLGTRPSAWVGHEPQQPSHRRSLHTTHPRPTPSAVLTVRLKIDTLGDAVDATSRLAGLAAGALALDTSLTRSALDD